MPSPQATKASSVRTLGFAGLAHRPGPAARSHDAEESLAASADGGIWLAFAGRLDNRSEIWRALPEPAGPLAALRDAELVLEAYRSWGTGCFERLLGPFAVALLDLPARQALLARDPTGARGLAYFLDEHRLVAASEDAAVAAGPAVGRELDEIRLAMYFGLTELVLGHSVFAKVKQLRPGHWLRVSPTQVEESCFYRPRFDDALLQANDDELAEELLYRLRLAVECRVGEPERTGVLMSGGLDSVPLAALAAERMPRGRALAAFSWVFDRHRRADERRHIEQAVEHLGLSPCYLHGDDALPLTPLSGWPTHPGTYEQNAYRLLHERAYRAAAEQGVTVLLTGMCGDQLYSGGSSWLAELVAQGEWRRAATELGWHLRHRQLGRAPMKELLRWLWQRWAGPRATPSSAPGWLSSRAKKLLPKESGIAKAGRSQRARTLLDPMNGHGMCVESYYGARYGLELRYPLRDRRVIEFFLALPTEQLYRRGVTRPILRRAFAGRIPQPILDRRDKASFEELFDRALYQEARDRVAQLLWSSTARWRDYLEPRYLERGWRERSLGLPGLLLWLAASLELWLAREQGLLPAEDVPLLPEPAREVLAYGH